MPLVSDSYVQFLCYNLEQTQPAIRWKMRSEIQESEKETQRHIAVDRTIWRRTELLNTDSSASLIVSSPLAGYNDDSVSKTFNY